MANQKDKVIVSKHTMEQLTTLLKAMNVMQDLLKKDIDKINKRLDLLEDCFRKGKDH
tara:strand:- start:916 stop:1086 length:171 start_codon:yes stop_codon:yes gene_type:complete